MLNHYSPLSGLTVEEQDRLCQIPGLTQLLDASRPERGALADLHPDAAFTLKVAADRREPCFEMACISHRALRAILAGDDIKSVRVKYDKDVAQFVKKHMWD